MPLEDFPNARNPPSSAPPYSEPFDPAAAEYITTRFRGGLHLAFVMEELYCLGHVLPCDHMVKALLAASGMAEEDELVLGPDGFVAHEGRVWGDVVVPGEVLSRACPKGV
ncbi:hypothetical protein MMC17_007418 [Xylographa soralifera]|nr:hypothetical protein [Xylographa soralifera]